MTLQEKKTAIIEKLKLNNIDIEEDALPVLMIVGYLSQLKALGIIDSEFASTPSGDNIISICNEVELKPTDLDIKSFVQELITDPQIQPAFMCLLMEFRDDKEKLIKDFNESKSDTGEQVS